MDSPYTATLNPKEERRLLRGHAWAYRNEFKQLPGIPDGALVDLFSARQHFIGRGFFQIEGGIAVRLMTRRQEAVDAAFFSQRLENARQLRAQLFPESPVYRWVHAESDGLPGLIIDRYDSLVIAQSSCAFYRDHRESIADILLATPGVEGVLFKVQYDTARYGRVDESYSLQIEELRLDITPEATQKTGLFLDQRVNSQAACAFAAEARVLEGHCYHGWWGIRLALAGAASVRGVDSSAAAIAQAAQNAALNGVEDRCAFETGDIEAVLEEGETHDIVLIDPPAYAKTRRHAKKALARYQALNAAAMAAVRPGGFLITSSCSHFVAPADFHEMLKQAASIAKRQARLIDFRGASPDHPVLLAMPETAYLKCAFVQVLS